MVRKHKNIDGKKITNSNVQVPSLHGRTKTIDQQLQKRMKTEGKQEEWLNEMK